MRVQVVGTYLTPAERKKFYQSIKKVDSKQKGAKSSGYNRNESKKPRAGITDSDFNRYI